MSRFGTNGGSSLSRPGDAPSRSDTVLVRSIDYNDDGEAFELTDPKAIKRRLSFNDAGWLTKEIDNYVDGSPSGDSDQTVTYEYTQEGLVDKITAKNPDTGDQVTEYFYGTTTTDSDVARSDLVREVAYPDSGGAGDRVVYTYNRQGQVKTKSDQASTEHTYEYDKLARLKHDRITNLGSGIDSTVKRLTLSYTVRGLLEKITHYDNSDTSKGSVVNEVLREYNDFGQIKNEYQEHSGAVDTASSLKTSYAYAGGTDNTIRRESITYPSGRQITLNYGATDGMNDVLSRLEAIKQGTTTYATYTYLGRARTVKVAYGEPGIDLTFIDSSTTGDGGDQYVGLDRFGRVVDMHWTDGSSAKERVKYGFDRDSNREWRENLVASSDEDEFYKYDGLLQLTNRQRGDLNSNKDGISGTPAKEEDFSLDPIGNWNQYTLKTSGNTDLDQSRSMNTVNEITDITETTGTAWPTPSHDAAGNLTKVPKPGDPGNSFDLTYDAWNRLVEVIDSGTTIAEYRYDGLSRRVEKAKVGRDFYYSDKWQILEERDGGSLDRQSVWGVRYADDLVAYDVDTDGDSTLEQRRYALHDFFNVTATAKTDGSIEDRYGYHAYGTRRVMDASFQSSSSTTTSSEAAYAGYVLDDESGLYQARHRYLHPKLGRWTARDPIGYDGGINLYGYVKANPVNGVDVDGTALSIDSVTAWIRFCMRRRKAQDLCDCLAVTIPNDRQFKRLCTHCTKTVRALRKRPDKFSKVLTAAEEICLCTCTLLKVERNDQCTDCAKKCDVEDKIKKVFD